MPELTLEEKVAKLEKKMQEAAPSPTGTPLIPPNVFKWVALAVGIALTALGSLVAIYPDVKAIQVALAIVGAVAAMLGIASPGLRKATGVLMMVGSVLGLSSCVHFDKPKLAKGLEVCAAGFVDSEVQAVLPDVLAAIQGKSPDWAAQLDTVLLKAGTAGICALGALISSLEGGTGGSPGAMPLVMTSPENGGLPRAVVLLRAYSYVESRK